MKQKRGCVIYFSHYNQSWEVLFAAVSLSLCVHSEILCNAICEQEGDRGERSQLLQGVGVNWSLLLTLKHLLLSRSVGYSLAEVQLH